MERVFSRVTATVIQLSPGNKDYGLVLNPHHAFCHLQLFAHEESLTSLSRFHSKIQYPFSIVLGPPLVQISILQATEGWVGNETDATPPTQPPLVPLLCLSILSTQA